jgi:EpsI family protein
MMSARTRAFVCLALMVAAFAAAWAWTPRVKLADSRPRVVLEFPRQFGEWRIDERMPVQLISPDQAAVLDKIYNQTLSRSYVNPQGERVMLSVAYGGDQSDGTRAHRPEVCYPAQGFEVLANARARLQFGPGDDVEVRRLVARLGGRIEPITYWVTVGEFTATSGTGQKLAQLRYGVRGTIPDGLLMRISTIDAKPERAYAVHDRFVRELRGAMAPSAAPLAFGRPGGAPT